MRVSLYHIGFAILLLFATAFAQQDNTATSSCDFADGMEVSVETHIAAHDEPHNGKIWMPGGAPLTLFTQAPLMIKNVNLGVGAYTMYVLPDKKNWTLIVSKNVTAGAKYDPAQDVVRAPMELGEIGQPLTQLQVSMAHSAPKVCSLRLYYGKVGAFAEFSEK